jgi:hypothetical protein
LYNFPILVLILGEFEGLLLEEMGDPNQENYLQDANLSLI